MTDYIDLETVKDALGKQTADDRDDLIRKAIKAASSLIDQHCGRTFSTDFAATARTFRAAGRTTCDGLDQVLQVDDIANTTGLAVATGTPGSWTTVTGWEAGPDNADAYGRPFTEIRGPAGWLTSLTRIQVTARWGWPDVPAEIAQAALLLTSRLYRRKDSPSGVLGNSEWGLARISRTDPDIDALISPLAIPVFA